MERNKILTIIIPTYNMEQYLRKCLDSLIVSEENMQRLEVLVVNDGSKDSSSAIGHEYEAKYPQTFRVIDKENGNYGSCVNRGLKEATGKYVKVLDADDYFDDSFWTFLGGMALDASADIIYLKSRSIDLDTGKESNRADYYNGLVDRFLRHEWRSEERILLSYDVPWGKIMRNKVIQENTVRFPQLTVAQDTVFSVTLATQ